MARKPKVGADDLFEIATYLAKPAARTEIHAELPQRFRQKFEQEYAIATLNYPLPASNRPGPYYVWPEGTNKQGMQLRIYFARVAPEPPPIKRLYTDSGKYGGQNQYRVNHSNLVMQLFTCGFVLGKNDENGDRINEFMRRQFPVRC